MTTTLHPLKKTIAGVAGWVANSVADIPELGIDESNRAIGRCRSCRDGQLGLMWRRRSGVTLDTVRCPLCNGVLAQTTHALRVNFLVLADDYVAHTAQALKDAAKAAQAERLEAGAAIIAKDIKAGDVVHCSGAGWVRVIGPSAKTPRTKNRIAIDVAVRVEHIRRHQPWSVITIEPRRTDELPLELEPEDVAELGPWADEAPGLALLAMARFEVETYERFAANARRDARTYGARVAGEVNDRAARYEAEAAEARAIVEALEAAGTVAA